MLRCRVPQPDRVFATGGMACRAAREIALPHQTPHPTNFLDDDDLDFFVVRQYLTELAAQPPG